MNSAFLTWLQYNQQWIDRWMDGIQLKYFTSLVTSNLCTQSATLWKEIGKGEN